MNLPITTRPLNLRPSSQAKVLPFNMIIQEFGNWCWTAVAVSINRFYEKSNGEWTPCKLVNETLNLNHCCQDDLSQRRGTPEHEQCDEEGSLRDALRKVKNYNTDLPNLLPPLFKTIQTQIDAAFPVGVSVITGRTRHFYVIRGYSPRKQLLYVANPTDGHSEWIPYSDFPIKGDRWDRTYITKTHKPNTD